MTEQKENKALSYTFTSLLALGTAGVIILLLKPDLFVELWDYCYTTVFHIEMALEEPYAIF